MTDTKQAAHTPCRHGIYSNRVCEICAESDPLIAELTRLRADRDALECELGRRCWHCKQTIYPGEPRKMFNPALSAASGGTWFWVHEKCPESSLWFRANAARLAEMEKDAERFQYLQNLPPVEAQQFFWNHQSRKQRAAAIDAAKESGK